ncbi:hypothetical protein [Amycolatopsis keratiniphila]|uniref:Uncharacterized protein n=1 Tax=Amycolatopsis keratiniphila TaxID=129921 RepID=W6HY76_9PSEU|nr:hypothetical protein [Amycolatopsis keratiniphila]AHJ58563.1 hypothetical protein AORI_P048 [Amycolatopsis keratiniphila]
MQVRVRATPIAQQQIGQLRGRPQRAFESWLQRIKTSGCKALTYRMTGEHVERLCVFHFYGELRVIVAFAAPQDARVLLVGPHDDADPGIDVYTQLFELLGIPRPTERVGKPDCCGPDKRPPVWGEDVEMLTDQFHKLAKRR